MELPQLFSEAEHISQFTEKGQRFTYCFNIGKKDTNCFSHCKSRVMFCYVFEMTGTALIYAIPIQNLLVIIMRLQELILSGV